jgi:hypothetical protein
VRADPIAAERPVKRRIGPSGIPDAPFTTEAQTAGTMIRPLSAALAAVAALLAACGGGSDTTATNPTAVGATSPAPTGTARPALTPQGGIDTLPGAGTRPVHVRATNTRVALLTDVRAGRHEGFDRVVFQFRRALPGYDVRYASRPIRQDGSGKAVRIAANHVVQVRMENALDADLAEPTAPLTYIGPQRLRPGTPEVVELARVGGFEGVLTWAVGLQDRVGFRVRTLDAPARLVVDFRNH